MDNSDNQLNLSTKSQIDDIFNKTSMLYGSVYNNSEYNDIIQKPMLLNELYINKNFYKWESDNNVKKIKIKYFPKNSFVICISSELKINSYPKSLIEAIKLLRKQGYNIILLILSKVKVGNAGLTKNLYKEIKSYDWIKFIDTIRENYLTYYRISDLLASTGRDYHNHIDMNLSIKEYLLVDKPILCSRGRERELELGKNYDGFYTCETCDSVPPIFWTKEYKDNKSKYQELYYKYFIKIDESVGNKKEIESIKNYILSQYSIECKAKLIENKLEIINHGLSKSSIENKTKLIENKLEIINHRLSESSIENKTKLTQNKLKIINYESSNDNFSKHKKKIVAIIPVMGRISLLKLTIKRLLEINKVHKVICVGHIQNDKLACESEGAIWLDHENYPLGKKWNYGFEFSKKFNPDGILFVGSSDWISSNWLCEAEKYLDNYGYVGKDDFYMADITENTLRICHWKGYISKARRNETIGIGRLISKKFLEKINYKPFDDTKHNSMDYTMYKKCIKHKFKIKNIKDDNFKFLSLSCDKWENKHKFFLHYLAAFKMNYNINKRWYHNLDNYKLYLNTDIIKYKTEVYKNIVKEFNYIFNFTV